MEGNYVPLIEPFAREWKLEADDKYTTDGCQCVPDPCTCSNFTKLEILRSVSIVRVDSLTISMQFEIINNKIRRQLGRPRGK